ncbi:MAG: hypothetical protein IJN37_08955 [Clostridia bacterium]|nr:hypothetical protein [Clostridia bacterium]
MDKYTRTMRFPKILKPMIFIEHAILSIYVIAFLAHRIIELHPLKEDLFFQSIADMILMPGFIYIIILYFLKWLLLPCPNCGKRTLRFSDRVTSYVVYKGFYERTIVCPKCTNHIDKVE